MGVYKYPRALYTKLTHSLIYFVATGNIEVKQWNVKNIADVTSVSIRKIRATVSVSGAIKILLRNRWLIPNVKKGLLDKNGEVQNMSSWLTELKVSG